MSAFMLGRALFLAATLISQPASAGAGVAKYSGRVSLYPAGSLRAQLSINFTAAEEDMKSVELYLNDGLQITALKCALCRSFKADRARKGALPGFDFSMPLVATFRRPLRRNQSVRFEIEYRGRPTPPSEDSNRFSPKWVELNLESLWFPLEAGERAFRSDLRIELPADYGFTANGEVGGASGHWHLQQRAGSDDIVLVAAPHLHRQAVRSNGLTFTLYSGDETSPQQSQQIAAIAERMLRMFGQWFGQAAQKSMSLVLNPRREVSYSRVGFISLNMPAGSDADNHFYSTLSHEIAHFWWRGAPTDTWENWLNEGFAEYSSLMYARATRGEQEFQERIAGLRERTKNRPPIWGLDRHSRDAYPVLYLKGALCLYELEQRVGRQQFLKVLAAFAPQSAKSTQKFLQLLKEQVSGQASEDFERSLREK